MVQVHYLPSLYLNEKTDTIISSYSAKTFTSCGKSKNLFEIIQLQAKFQTQMVLFLMFIVDHKF